jgi:hypothetical protein
MPKASGIDPERGFVAAEDALHEAAAHDVGADDFGDPWYREGLRVLLDSYDREAKLTPLGRKLLFDDILEVLRKRLRCERAWKEHPEALAHEIRRPIVILGLIRTGSTALHYLMGQDPGLQHLQYWLARDPRPRPPRDTWESYPEYQTAKAAIEAMYAPDPELKAMHWMEPWLPDECGFLLAQSFTDDGYEVRATSPSYSRWYRNASIVPAYERHRRLVQWIGSTDPERRWLLKYPVHVRHLRDLLQVYPDACVVWTHRDPSRVIHSYASLIGGFRGLFEDDIDLCEIARDQMEIWSEALERAIECRRERDPEQFLDVQFSDFRANPVGTVERIYSHFGQPLSEEGARRLREWVVHNPEERHGKHAYAHKHIGLSREEILERFSSYMRFFGMEPERRNER